MPIHRLSRALLLCLLGAPAAACPLPTALTPHAIRQSFTETRTLAGLPTPLESAGTIAVTPTQVDWHTTAPFDIDTLITATGMTQSINGGTAQPMAPGSSAVEAQMSKIIASLLQGRWSDLQSTFQIATFPGTGPWRVTLHPLDPQLAGFLGDIAVQGCTTITSFALTQPNGDAEVIQLTGPAAP